jgi:DEAD/DEAH box helicase domain-containing protein
MQVPDIASLITNLYTRAADAAIARNRIVHGPLREALRDRVRVPAGEAGSFLSEPVFEAMFGWNAADRTMHRLAEEGLLHPALVAALAKDEPLTAHGRHDRNTFPRKRAPYTHQLESWQRLRSDPPCPLVVTSGTGSGKTECFLVPILDDLYRQRERFGRLVGVQALFLYPLNALIASQQDRLSDWTEPSGGDIRFCLYNGNTPPQISQNEAARTPWEVRDRRTLRSSPPPILVTNATMLEYMLVRAADGPILGQSVGRLRWIVLDEAHTYVGSQAAEMALLLRRTLHAFGVVPDQVRFVATSATLGEGEAARRGLREFLAHLSGRAIKDVQVVVGERHVPTLRSGDHAGLADDPAACKVRQTLAAGPTTLSQLATASGDWDPLDLLDLAASSADSNQAGFLPLRMHLFHRAQPGVWACVSPNCSGRIGTRLDHPDWPFGNVIVRDSPRCPDCGGITLQVVVCDDCGAPYLEASSDQAATRVARLFDKRPMDDFAAEAETEVIDGDENAERESDSRVLLAQHGLSGGTVLAIDPITGLTPDTQRDDLVRLGRHEPNNGCPCCGAGNSSQRLMFRPLRLGGPFMVGNAMNVLLDAAPEGPNATRAPHGGRQMLTFSDSRQGTARLAATWQREAERNYARAVLLHAVTVGDPAASERAASLQSEIDTLVATRLPALDAMIAKKRAELEKTRGGGLGWAEARRQLGARNAQQLGLRKIWEDRDPAFQADDALADLQLHAEFLRRPTRGNNLETMGLVALRFDAIERAVKLPDLFSERGATLEDWRDFLSVAVNQLIRATRAVHVTDHLRNWIGQRAYPRVFVLANADGPLKATEVRWPMVRQPGFQRSRLVRLLVRGLNLNLDELQTRNLVNDSLDQAFGILRAGMGMKPLWPNLQLDLAHANLVVTEQVYGCPITLRLLDRCFRGITPYIPMVPGARPLTCSALNMPKLPNPWLRDANGDDRLSETEAWLQEEPAVGMLRREGVWSDLHDRLVLLSPFVRIAEHSAQQPGSRLRGYEQEFKAGRINVLACSTTMEMGVDIGGVTTVAMTNVPPSPANYRQRVGRAGRRMEPLAVAFTYCPDDPLGWAMFDQPVGMLEREIRPPRVALESRPIVRRHVNAFLLSKYLASPECPAMLDTTRLPSVWFFGPANDANPPSKAFVAWLRLRFGEPGLNDALKHLVMGSGLAGSPDLIERCAEQIEALSQTWRIERDAVAADLIGAQGAAQRAVEIQLRRMENAFLLGELTASSFLPGHGFPTGIVPFVALAPADRAHDRSQHREREDNIGAWRREFPTRGIETAIREYAPGSDVVLDGLVYRSAGVTLNWQRPATESDVREIQSLRWFWNCPCGAAGDSLRMPAVCSACGRADPKREHILEPAGFSTDLLEPPGADAEAVSFVPGVSPLVSVPDADWVVFDNPDAGRMRATANGLILGLSRGAGGEGYAICLQCGRAEPEHGTADVKASPLGAHRRLRRGREQLSCDAVAGNFAIQRNLRLGFSRRTDVCEIQLTGIADEPVAVTCAVAFREGLSRELGIERDELGWASEQRRGPDGQQTWSLLVFDTAAGGAGYATAATRDFPSLVRAARAVLKCGNPSCETACPSCLITRDTTAYADQLNRRAADIFLDQLDRNLNLPSSLRVFGPDVDQWMCARPLPTALDEALELPGAGSLILHLSGKPTEWDLGSWWACSIIDRHSRRGVDTLIAVPADALRTLGFDLLLALNSLVQRGAPHVRVVQYRDIGAPASLMASIRTANGMKSWAATGQALPITAVPPEGIVMTSALTWTEPGPTFDIHQAVTLARPALSRILVSGELDGRVDLFGSRFWKLIQERSIPARQWFDAGKVVHVEYDDRYLFNPLAIALLAAVLKSIPGKIAKEADRPTAIIRTLADRPGNVRQSQPYAIFHDWGDSAIRDYVLKSASADAGFNVSLETAPRSSLPHGRDLRLRNAEGMVLDIMLDQGFGYWRSRTGSFDFAARPSEQARSVISGIISVVGSPNYPTTFIVEVLNPA